jgi:hypothetical protein
MGRREYRNNAMAQIKIIEITIRVGRAGVEHQEGRKMGFA